MKYALLIALALAMVVSSAMAAEITSFTNLEKEVLVAGTSVDRAYYDWWHSESEYVATPSSTNTPLTRSSGNLALQLTADGSKLSDMVSPITVEVYGKPVLGPNNEQQIIRTGFYLGGTLYDIKKPATVVPNWDPEFGTVAHGAWIENAGFTRDAYGWMSGKVTSDNTADDGGPDQMWKDAQLQVSIPGDQTATEVVLDNGHTLKAGFENDNPLVGRVVAHGAWLNNEASTLYEAYMGASQTGSIKDIPNTNVDRVSGYGDVYGGFLDAWIDPNGSPIDYDNRIEIEMFDESGQPFSRPEWVWYVEG